MAWTPRSLNKARSLLAEPRCRRELGTLPPAVHLPSGRGSVPGTTYIVGREDLIPHSSFSEVGKFTDQAGGTKPRFGLAQTVLTNAEEKEEAKRNP